jgi:hypothetical protein
MTYKQDIQVDDAEVIYKNWVEYCQTFHLGEDGSKSYVVIVYEYWMRLLERQISEAKKEQIEVVRKWAERTIIDTGISNGYYNALSDLLTFLEGLK